MTLLLAIGFIGALFLLMFITLYIYLVYVELVRIRKLLTAIHAPKNSNNTL